MKTTRLLTALAASLLLASCGGDDEVVLPGSETKPISSDTSANTNRNTSGPAAARERYEFPRLKGGTSDVVVHECTLNSSTGEEGVNYSVEWDHTLKATRWVCYQMYSSVRASNWNRNNWANGDPWAYDPAVPQGEQQETYNELSKTRPSLPHSTYYQKGHIVASADRLCSQDANRQTFYMTNIYPMAPDFNENIWSSMEDRVRKWASQSDTLYVCKGGTIDSAQGILERTIGGHIVPRYFFMALLSKRGATLKALAFWIEHQDGNGWSALKDYVVSIDELERKTGIDFFCNLPDETESSVEATVTLSDWNLK